MGCSGSTSKTRKDQKFVKKKNEAWRGGLREGFKEENGCLDEEMGVNGGGEERDQVFQKVFDVQGRNGRREITVFSSVFDSESYFEAGEREESESGESESSESLEFDEESSD
ncbi:unnamed protein product [Moneuplotes crassus]|uniref:Uncharacterized protein n=1 Tax=Euplotes crassus TaxID=5936 RepID=A0AAD2D7S3_EUPCR|nr:unnamed protein product [Moneuplotes crassus]